MVVTRSQTAKKPDTAVIHQKSRVSKQHSTSKSSQKRKSGVPKSKPQLPTTGVSIRLTSAINTTSPEFIVHGDNEKALFTLVAYRGDGMCLLAMNWKQDTPLDNFVGFAIEYQEPGGSQFYAIPNRIAFPSSQKQSSMSSRLAPFQKFRWVHFPYHAGLPGTFTYRVTPVFMDASAKLTYGDFQDVGIELEAETYPGELNICYTRGFISSQAFVSKFGTNGGVGTILPPNANSGIDFKPSDPKYEEALSWMGFEARAAIISALDAAIADPTAQVRVAAYDFNNPEIVDRLQQVKDRLKIIIDNSGSHKAATSAESKAAEMLAQSAGADNVQRQHMGGLQHNKMMIIDGDKAKIAIGGSTNFSWRGLYVQNNNAVVIQGADAVKVFVEAFNNLWAHPNGTAGFNDTISAAWNKLGLPNIDAQVTFSPHSSKNGALQGIANDINSTESSLFYSLAFLYETKGVIQDSIKNITNKDETFVYGLSDKAVGGLELQFPNGNPPVAFPSNLMRHVPPPFQSEATGGSGTRLHHKFIVIDFNKPTARVYTGSYNFSTAADSKNGENLFLIKDQRVATSYMIEALTMFDHYEFRNFEASSQETNTPIQLQIPPVKGSGIKPWWDRYWTNAQKKHDRELFGI